MNLNFNGTKIKTYLKNPTDFTAFYQVYVTNDYKSLISKISKGDVVIDAGANIGLFTIIASILVGKSGRVISIEPDPENLKILKKNIQLNNLDNIIIVDKALYKESGKKLRFYSNGIFSKIVESEKYEIRNYIEVETITLDDIISDFNLRPNSLKMDIEGGEKFALLSAHRTFKNINYFEGEIHSLEDYNVLLQYSDLYAFKKEPTNILRSAINFFLKHPLKTFNIELHNKFYSTKQILTVHAKRQFEGQLEEFPVIVYGQRLVG
jgi:FkbM family methyltransferase